MSDLDLKKLIGAALMVPPTDNWHYPLSENQLRYLIDQSVKAEREACALMAQAFGRNGYDFTGDLELHEAIRARGEIE